MSISGIASSSLPQLGAGPQIQPSRRQSEDMIGRQLEQDLQSGNLAGAQQAYYQLAAFGANGSGPFTQPNMQSEFQALGADLQSGNLSAAQTDNATLTSNLLTNDVKAVHQDQKNGDSQAYQTAMSNLKGDYWAVYGQQANNSDLQAMISGSTPISVQA
ncbi:MAG TPA: hypothetical protein VKR57_01185 [Terriglobales bacterium]|jgi:hypothetical protein|nr:hypothetical protein [Terriglobales bacterium]